MATSYSKRWTSFFLISCCFQFTQLAHGKESKITTTDRSKWSKKIDLKSTTFEPGRLTHKRRGMSSRRGIVGSRQTNIIQQVKAREPVSRTNHSILTDLAYRNHLAKGFNDSAGKEFLKKVASVFKEKEDASLNAASSANLVFLLDCSRNVGLEVIQSYKVFVKEVCEHIGILPSGMNFGLLECGVVSRHQNGIKTYETVNDLDETLEGIVPGSGKCELGRAIQDVDQETFAALPNTAPKVLVIILAGQVGDDAANQALELKKQGVRIIALGIGPQVNMEKFGGIADSPLYAFKVPMFEYLLSMSSTVEGFVNHVIKPNYGVNKIKNESFEGENTTSLQDDLINLGSDDVSPLTEYNDTSSSTDSVNQFMNQLGNQESDSSLSAVKVGELQQHHPGQEQNSSFADHSIHPEPTVHAEDVSVQSAGENPKGGQILTATGAVNPEPSHKACAAVGTTSCNLTTGSVGNSLLGNQSAVNGSSTSGGPEQPINGRELGNQTKLPTARPTVSVSESVPGSQISHKLKTERLDRDNASIKINQPIPNSSDKSATLLVKQNWRSRPVSPQNNLPAPLRLNSTNESQGESQIKPTLLSSATESSRGNGTSVTENNDSRTQSKQGPPVVLCQFICGSVCCANNAPLPTSKPTVKTKGTRPPKMLPTTKRTSSSKPKPPLNVKVAPSVAWQYPPYSTAPPGLPSLEAPFLPTVSGSAPPSLPTTSPPTSSHDDNKDPVLVGTDNMKSFHPGQCQDLHPDCSYFIMNGLCDQPSPYKDIFNVRELCMLSCGICRRYIKHGDDITFDVRDKAKPAEDLGFPEYSNKNLRRDIH